MKFKCDFCKNESDHLATSGVHAICEECARVCNSVFARSKDTNYFKYIDQASRMFR